MANKKPTLDSVVEKLSAEAKNLSESEFATLAEFFDDLSQTEQDVQVFLGACDQFIESARYFKREFSKVK